MSRIKLVAIDLDGTLLNEDLTIPKEAIRCMQAVMASGVTVTLASGRVYRSAFRYAAQIGLGDFGCQIPLITFNGAMVREFPDGKVIATEPVPLEPALKVARLARESGYDLITFGEDAIYCKAMTRCIKVYTSIAGLPATVLGDALYEPTVPPMKMILFEEDPERMAVIETQVRSLVGDILEIAYSYPFFLEIMDPKATKGYALLRVAKRLGVLREEIMAIGDSFNDLPMLKEAGLGIAVSNAPDEVKEKAAFVTSGARSKGVIEAIEKFILTSPPS